MNGALIGLVAWLSVANLQPGTELQYVGSLSQQAKTGESEVKSFSLYAVTIDDEKGDPQLAYYLEERGGGSFGWPERFGLLPLAGTASAKPRPIRLLYTHNDQQYPLPVRSPLCEFADKLTPQATWTEGRYTYVVTRKKNVKGREGLVVEVASNFGPVQTMVIEPATGILLSLEEKIIIGRGDEFQLKLDLQSQKQIPSSDLDRNRASLMSLLSVKAELGRTGDQKVVELTRDQLKSLQSNLPQYEKEAEGTGWSRLVASIGLDLKQQKKRLDGVAGLEKKLVGRPAPEWTLKLTDGSTFTSDDAKDKVVVLHFWQYRGEPLNEPYGQIGYLDFLNNKRKKLGVRVIGVNVDERFANPDQKNTALRSMKKLLEFMNVGYDMAIDDETALSEFGDPRATGAPLPLWIVIGHDGKVAHHHTGFYDIKPDEGLKQLDDAVIEAIRRRKGK
ncbi:peroxiredoxin family protein [Schlesneria sp. DSM 10557]|uniref:peroxiredoxin family protein n=1 Tax=Schlesneria sp. DSM 10557 TaxID=3044399 RepID=UPI0035A134D9